MTQSEIQLLEQLAAAVALYNGVIAELLGRLHGQGIVDGRELIEKFAAGAGTEVDRMLAALLAKHVAAAVIAAEAGKTPTGGHSPCEVPDE